MNFIKTLMNYERLRLWREDIAFKLKINPEHFAPQGLEIDPNLLFLIKDGESL